MEQREDTPTSDQHERTAEQKEEARVVNTVPDEDVVDLQSRVNNLELHVQRLFGSVTTLNKQLFDLRNAQYPPTPQNERDASNSKAVDDVRRGVEKLERSLKQLVRQSVQDKENFLTKLYTHSLYVIFLSSIEQQIFGEDVIEKGLVDALGQYLQFTGLRQGQLKDVVESVCDLLQAEQSKEALKNALKRTL